MKSALRIVAFSNRTTVEGITALLELAIEELDRAGYSLPAAHADLALATFQISAIDRSYSLKSPISKQG